MWTYTIPQSPTWLRNLLPPLNWGICGESKPAQLPSPSASPPGPVPMLWQRVRLEKGKPEKCMCSCYGTASYKQAVRVSFQASEDDSGGEQDGRTDIRLPIVMVLLPSLQEPAAQLAAMGEKRTSSTQSSWRYWIAGNLSPSALCCPELGTSSSTMQYPEAMLPWQAPGTRQLLRLLL